STSPPPAKALYILLSVGGQKPPVVTNAQPGDTITLVGSSIRLTEPATAKLAQRYRVVHPGTPATTTDFTTNYSYRIIGDSLALDPPPCGPAELCAKPPGGRFLNGTLLLTYGPDSPSYLYTLA